MITKPLLAVEADLEKIVFPILVSPKIDGIRCLYKDGKVLSRTFKPIPNKFIRRVLEEGLVGFEGLDGELMLRGNPTFQQVTSAVMSHDGEPDFVYHVFDHIKDSLTEPFNERYARLHNVVSSLQEVIPSRIIRVEHTHIYNLDELAAYEQKAVAEGNEGVMIRKYDGKYKCGRSTLNEGILLKCKRFADSEARILGFEEKLHNNNEKTVDALGHSKRSSHKENKVGIDTLGKFLVVDIASGVEFKIGTGIGLGDDLRKQVWENKENYLGQIVKYKYQPFGVKETTGVPRIPIFLGFRHENDL